ncbi:beta-ketoacyl-[acyl-carrier-protein] synthase family protein [Phytohabitans rumicis]|uniref:Beta-ACP synthase n=1 Tax=Phytohabitans rumicis TaxID=1076125 RepID=A0A6V8LG49_9ACTN|nr:beta-ketoacyl synthase N-terminal-like domain-containing protein [Phytohabitans rumicis]GFJ91615.1 beta-ACP synthase [Phytohabitans rumicis]
MAETAVLTGLSAVTAAGRGTAPLLAAALDGAAAFGPVTRFDTGCQRVGTAATLPDATDLPDELAGVVDGACAEAGLSAADRASTPLLLAARVDATLARLSTGQRQGYGAAALAGIVAERCGLGGPLRAYTAACVAASTAIAEAASMIAAGRLDRAVVAAGFLVDPDNLALFDAGRALADDGRIRPFSAGRRGLLLGDGVAAVVLESASAARRRGTPPLARLAGWGRAGDAYHVCQPDPAGAGLAKAIDGALRRGGVRAGDVGYVNANGTGTRQSDPAEAAGLRRALGDAAGTTPVSSTKSVHGHALEASGLVELVLTVLALRAGRLPVNAGYLAPDPDCELDLVLDQPRPVEAGYALSVNSAFGGANTALLVGAA